MARLAGARGGPANSLWRGRRGVTASPARGRGRVSVPRAIGLGELELGAVWRTGTHGERNAQRAQHARKTGGLTGPPSHGGAPAPGGPSPGRRTQAPGDGVRVAYPTGIGESSANG